MTTHTETVEITCRRCGGAGERPEWRHTGSTCFDCGGAGTEVVTAAAAAESIALSALGDIESRADGLIGEILYGETGPALAPLATRIASQLHALEDSDAARSFVLRLRGWDLSGVYGGSSADALSAARAAARMVCLYGSR